MTARNGQTHQKRARELALRERRELKAAKKAERRAADEAPPDEDAAQSPAEPEGQEQPA